MASWADGNRVAAWPHGRENVAQRSDLAADSGQALVPPAVGAATDDIPVAWLHVDSGDLLYLPQRYERHAAQIYLYSGATLGFTAGLAIDDDGFVRSYPGLWTRDA